MFGKPMQACLHAFTNGPAIAIQVEVIAVPAERLFEDGIDQLDSEEKEAHQQDYRQGPKAVLRDDEEWRGQDI